MARSVTEDVLVTATTYRVARWTSRRNDFPDANVGQTPAGWGAAGLLLPGDSG